MEKTIVLTGVSGGLGLIIAETLLSENYKIIGISRTKNKNLSFLEEKYAGKLIHIEYDMENSQGVEVLYKKNLKSFGPIHGLVNNAAWAYDDICTNADLGSLNKMFSVNVYSSIMLTKYIIRDMLLNDVHGSLVHVSSVSVKKGFKGLSMYAATKGAIEAFSKGLSREWGGRGIRSNCVSPGFMETSMSSSLSLEQRQKIYRRTSLGTSVDIFSVASAVSFLLDSERSASITGTVFDVDGGN